MAVHAGWRGVEQKIVLSALQCFPAHLRCHLGVSICPHIDQNHFEVDQDVAQQLAQSSPQGKEYLKPVKGGSKYQVSLIGIVTDQLKAHIQLKNNYFFDKSTFFIKNLFNSYRRTAERLLGQFEFYSSLLIIIRKKFYDKEDNNYFFFIYIVSNCFCLFTFF